MKKFTALFLSAVMALSSFNFVLASSYAHREYVVSEFIQAVGKNKFQNKSADLSAYDDGANINTEYREYMEIAVANGIVNGYNDNTLKPDNNITRAEAAVMLSRCLGNVEITESEKHFTDVPQWAEEAVNKLTQGGIINGYNDTTFGSYDFITVEQVKILTDKIEESLNNYNLKDDYYSYFNEKFKRNNSLKSGQQCLDNFNITNNVIEERIENIITSAANESDSNAKRITSVYNLYTNSEARENEGLNSLMPYLNAIDNISSVKDIPELEAYLEKDLGRSMLLNFSISINPDDSTKNVIQIGESETILPRDFYFNLSSDKVKKAYISYVSSILTKAGDTEGARLAEDVYNFEMRIIQKSGTSDNNAYYVLTDRNSLNSHLSNIDAEEFLNILIPSKGSKVSIYNAYQLSEMSSFITSDNINVIKAYYKANLIDAYSDCLTKDIYNSRYSLYNTMYGTITPSYESNGVSFVKTYAGFATIDKYAEKYYDAEKEQSIKSMINDIRSYYEIKLQNNSWLSDETKAKAIKKLENINIQVGYPTTAKPYASEINIVPVEDGGTLIGNIISIEKLISQYDLTLPETSVDKNDWSISAFMVNACYVPLKNEIIIPLGIMEEPFYNKDADYYENLGALGMIVAHEISHAFDLSGANFDENGNRVDWWTEADKNKFYDLADAVIAYFGKYEVAGGVDNRASNTVLENIADLGAVSCIVGITKEKGGNVKTVLQSFAQSWSEIATDEYLKILAETDSHSVSKIRVNGVLSSIDEFYSEYDIKEGDGMYKAPADRVSIW